MRLYNRYLSILGLSYVATTVILASYSQNSLDLYFSVFLIEYLVVTLVFAGLNPKARRILTSLGFILFGFFLAIVVMKVIQSLVKGGAFS